MSNSCDDSSASTPVSPSIDYSQFKQKLQEQLVNMCTSRGEAGDSSAKTTSAPKIDYSTLSKFQRTITMPALEKQSITDQRPRCCFEGFAVNRARYFVKGVLEGRMFPGPNKEILQSNLGAEEGPVHAKDRFADPLHWWLLRGTVQGMIDGEAGILPGENEKLELLLQVDPELLVLWHEKHITLEKEYRAYPDKLFGGDELSDNKDSEGNSEPADDKLSGDTDQNSEISEDHDNDVSMNELHQFSQLRSLAAHLNQYHPDQSQTVFNITLAETRVRGEFKRIKTALEYLQKHQDLSSKVESFNILTKELGELACNFLKYMIEMYEDDIEVAEHIFAAFFKEFSMLYPNPEESKGRDAEEIEYQKQFVIAVAKRLGAVMSEQE